MFNEKMYVRCPADMESSTDPRVFVCGQILSINEFEKTVTVSLYDPFGDLIFFDNLPKNSITLPIGDVDHCTLFNNSKVVYNGIVCRVISCKKEENGYFSYYLKAEKSNNVFKAYESDIIASFTNGKVDPIVQMRRYELQNPCWYGGHAIVSRSMNILENSIYGFKELAGSKIYLLPHQVNTIMRCLQEKPCRYMLADEVGMGKTIEAISILKIFLKDQSNKKILIVVPDTLKKQWEMELFLKFDIVEGKDLSGNQIYIRTLDTLKYEQLYQFWDFTIIDEVHKYLSSEIKYSKIHSISINSKNILLLSATPVQQRREEYLDLLRILQPIQYDNYSLEDFSNLLNKQNKIIQKTALVLDDLGDFQEEVLNIKDNEKDPHGSEDCEELFEEIYDSLEGICSELEDPKLIDLLSKINFEDEDLGIQKMKVILSYICSNYQIESNIIRNRRKMLEVDDEGERLLPIRKLDTITYNLDEDKNVYEARTYNKISEWIDANKGKYDPENILKPILSSFFSSPWAFESEVNKLKGINLDSEIISNAKSWLYFENNILENINSILDDPDSYEDEFSTRIVSIFDLLTQELYDKKIVIFTSYLETFKAYRTALLKVFGVDKVSFFGEDMSSSELEVNAYKFQNEKTCNIMLCDSTGGEGRNFQCADYIIHIDLPWDANMIEQRIGRLDRLERDKARPVVQSIVVYANDTFESVLFEFWNKGLNIFTQSLSGMEIIMKDINKEIISAIEEDFQYGLFNRVPKIIELANSMRDEVRKEQNYDAAGFMFRPMYTELKKLIEYYSKNENMLFANAMNEWASLVGFHGDRFDDVITYRESLFSTRSAVNSQFIPPSWDLYLNKAQSKFLAGVENDYKNNNAESNNDKTIKGTYIRKKAIENDYLHFFAPGDAVFDSIVENAMSSCKGQSCAFAAESEINWCGFIFTWSLKPNENILLDNNISIYALGPYRNYLMADQVIVPVSIMNKEEHSNDDIIREYNKIINGGILNSKIVHLGKRSRSAGFLRGIIPNDNISWFKNKYPEEKWHEFVNVAYRRSNEIAKKQFLNRSNIRGAREEMERALSAKIANNQFYGLDGSQVKKLMEEQKYVLEALKHAKITLDSAAFVWMVKVTYE